MINKSAGSSFRANTDYINFPYQTNVHTDAALTGITSYYYTLQNSTSVSILSAIDPDNYDNGGTLTALAPNKYHIQRIFYYPVSNIISIMYAQQFYTTMDDAISNYDMENVIFNSDLMDGSVLRCFLVLKSTATDLTASSARFIPAHRFHNVY